MPGIASNTVMRTLAVIGQQCPLNLTTSFIFTCSTYFEVHT
jgi:hypothetical protein